MPAFALLDYNFLALAEGDSTSRLSVAYTEQELYIGRSNGTSGKRTALTRGNTVWSGVTLMRDPVSK